MPNSENLLPNMDSMSSRSSLIKLGEEILSIWEKRVRNEISSAGELLRPVLRDALPQFLALLAEALSEKNSRGLIGEGSELVREHAGERARTSGFSPSQIVQELQMLRETVTSRLENAMNLTTKDYETIQRTFDEAIQQALIEFFLVHAKIREQFMATLSHDLRNPIGVAKMGAQIIQDVAQDIQNTKIRKDLTDLADRIIANMKRADRMIQDLLDTSILRIGEKLPTNISRCDLLTIVHDVVTELDENEKSRIQITGSPIGGFWDCDGLRRSLENLVKNAIKYGAKKTPINIKVARTDQGVRLSVHNHGNPIPEQDQKLIFRAFGRTKSAIASDQKGWGIGLALVQAVSESLGGSVSVESTEKAGTTFTIDLPEDSRTSRSPFDQIH